MKIAKNELKNLIKECLIEILCDGIGENLIEARKMNSRHREPILEGRIDQRKLNNPIAQQRTNVLNNAIAEAAGKNSVMKDIFADTAERTLPSMLEGNKKGYQPVGTSIEEALVHETEPEDLFGNENVDRWAKLAFESPVIKRPG